jgi:glycerophosphoryl diester phosphodiesterase
MKPFFRAATHEPEVIAHRGGGGEWPGETMYAFDQALKLRVDVLELDVRRTKGEEKDGAKDGEIILMHNGSVNKTTDGMGCVT